MPIFVARKCGKFRPFRTTFQAIWQIGALTAERSIFGARGWPLSAVSHYVLSEKPGNAYFCSAKMRQIPTVSHYVSSYLAKWHSYCRTEHFGARGWPLSAVSHYILSEKPGNAYFCKNSSAKMRQIPTVSHYVSSYLAKWRSYCRTEHSGGPKMTTFGRFALPLNGETRQCLVL